MPYLQDAHCTLYHGDCLDVLQKLPAESVQCCVTSPPYWGLRNYSYCPCARNAVAQSDCQRCSGTGKITEVVEKQIGLESTLKEYIMKLTEVFRGVRRVLRKDGTFWLNIGDSYGSGTAMGRQVSKAAKHGYGTNSEIANRKKGSKAVSKELLGIPWRLAFTLQDDGWFLRQDIIWHKPSTMPESITDRCTKAHEYLFLLVKNARYYFDQEAIREKTGSECDPEGRNKRSVWTIASASYPGAHFAVFPAELVKPCILAGTSEEGCCAKCGAPWRRITEKERKATRPGRPGRKTKVLGFNAMDGRRLDSYGRDRRYDKYIGSRAPLNYITQTTTVGWEPSCKCEEKAKDRCLVLDPFAGTSTVGVVARECNCRFIGIDLSEEYCRQSAKRLGQKLLL